MPVCFAQSSSPDIQKNLVCLFLHQVATQEGQSLYQVLGYGLKNTQIPAQIRAPNQHREPPSKEAVHAVGAKGRGPSEQSEQREERTERGEM